MLLGIEPDKIFSETQQNLRWKNFKQLSAENINDVVSEKVFPFIKNMHEIRIPRSASINMPI